MFIFFGWGRQTIKNYGITFEHMCSNCNNEDYWQLVRSTTWFTLFFIPVIPYEQKYFILCPICEYGIRINGNDIYNLKVLAEANTELINKRTTVDEYNSRVSTSHNNANNNKPEYIEAVEIEEERKDNEIINKFCSKCGNKVDNKYNFCQSCGNKLK